MSAIVGFFDQYNNADQAIQNLQNYGVENDRISIVVRDTEAMGTKHHGIGTAALTGAATGGLVGIVAGLGTLLVPDMGLIAVAGTLATPLTATLGILGAATGGLLGALINLGLSSEDAETYTKDLRHGGTLVFVETDSQKYDDQGEIKHILRSAGAVDINAPRPTWNEEGSVSVGDPKDLIHT